MVAIRSATAAVGISSRPTVLSPTARVPTRPTAWEPSATATRLGDSASCHRCRHSVGALRRACMGSLAEGRSQLCRRWRRPHHRRHEHTRHHDNRSQHDIPDDHTRRELPGRCVCLPRWAGGRKLQGVRDQWWQNFVRVRRGSSDGLRKLRCRGYIQDRVRT